MARIDVTYGSGEAYGIAVRGHELTVDQPLDAGGDDKAPTPVELFVASLASCVAYYAGRYLARHDLPRDGLRVAAEYEMSSDRPARVAGVRITVVPPAGLAPERQAALKAVASHCTVHNTLRVPPEVAVAVG